MGLLKHPSTTRIKQVIYGHAIRVCNGCVETDHDLQVCHTGINGCVETGHDLQACHICM